MNSKTVTTISNSSTNKNSGKYYQTQTDKRADSISTSFQIPRDFHWNYIFADKNEIRIDFDHESNNKKKTNKSVNKTSSNWECVCVSLCRVARQCLCLIRDLTRERSPRHYVQLKVSAKREHIILVAVLWFRPAYTSSESLTLKCINIVPFRCPFTQLSTVPVSVFILFFFVCFFFVNTSIHPYTAHSHSRCDFLFII